MDRDRTVHSSDASLDGPDTSWKNSTIAARSSRDRRVNVVESPLRRGDDDRRAIMTTIVARSRPDHGPIAARSWPDRG